jgi:hypothetical protein
MPAALLLGQDVDLGLERGMGLDRAGLGHDLAALDLLALDAPQQEPDVVPGAALVEDLLEHLDAGDDDLAGGLDADDLDVVADLDDAALDPARGDRAPALDAEDVLDGHQEGLVDGALRRRDIGVDRVHQLLDGRIGRIGRVVGRLERLQRGTLDDRHLVARELVLGEELAHLELDQLEQLGVVDHVDLVQEDHDVGHLDLARQQDVLARDGAAHDLVDELVSTSL